MPESEEEFLEKLRAAFEIEAREHLQTISAGLLELEGHAGGPESPAIVERIFRGAHSLKGAARSVDRRDIEAVCQSLESVFARWKSGGVEARREAFDALNASVAQIEVMLFPAGSAPAAPAPVVAPAPSVAPTPAPSPAPPAAPAPAPPKKPEVAPSPPPAPTAPPVAKRVPPAPAHRGGHEPLAATVRIPMAKMDALLRGIEEMTVLKNAARQRLADLATFRQSVRNWRANFMLLSRNHPASNGSGAPAFIDQVRGWLEACDHSLGRLADDLEQDRRAFGSLFESLLGNARTLAMLPFSTVLDLLPRQVRELARAEGKIAELTLEGRDLELDKRILEQIKDPLLHLVRNCVDHGIERPEVRRARGKPEGGRIHIRVSYRNATQVEISIQDDGGGIDAGRLKEAAVAAGTVSPGDAAALSEHDALLLIFRSGVSTSPSVTEISGRGLGMAIVSERVEELGGTVDVGSRPGHGVHFQLLLPVAFATFSGVLVDCGRESLVVPMANLERALWVPRREIERDGRRETIRWNGEVLPLARLRDVLDIRSTPARLAAETLQVLILFSGGVRMAFAVDAVKEQLELLLKPFRRPIVHARNFAAAGLLPSGRAVLVLNVPEVIESAIALENKIASAEPEPLPLEKQPRDILVVDDSVTSRMLLKNILETSGYRVKTASDGLDALTALRTQRFDLVVSDVQMPRMDGFDLASRIRADKQLGGIPVVLVTALESSQDRARGAEAGAAAYLVKSSFQESNLVDVIRGLL